MIKFMTKSMVAVVAVAPMLAACPAAVPNIPGQMARPITGNVIKGTAPFENATVRLIQTVNNASQNREVKSTDKNGNFTFENVPPGTYRVAFDRATPSQVNNKETVYYTAGTDTFGYYTTAPFTFDGQTAATYTVPQMNVAWTANLSPAPDAAVSAPVNFSWSAAPGAQGYKIRIADPQDNTVFTSATLPASTTTFTWDGMGNNANYAGKKVAAGGYAWSVNLSDGTAGTNISKFTLQ